MATERAGGGMEDSKVGVATYDLRPSRRTGRLSQRRSRGSCNLKILTIKSYTMVSLIPSYIAWNGMVRLSTAYRCSRLAILCHPRWSPTSCRRVRNRQAP